MIYRVILDGIDIYDTVEGRQIIKGSVDVELNGAGSCEITLPYNHESYDLAKPMVSEIEIVDIESDEIIWFGRVTDISVNWNNEKKIVAEGALAYFNDSIIRPYSCTNVYLSEFFSTIIEKHNELVPAGKQFTVGYVRDDASSIKVTRTVNYMKTFDVIQEQCLKAIGGYIFLRKEIEDDTVVQYIDWYKDIPYNSGQDVQFGINLLDLTSSFSATDILTAVIPLGDDGDGGQINISGSTTTEPGYTVIRDFIQNDEAVEAYGLITEVIEFNDVNNKTGLVEQGVSYLKSKQFDHLYFECDVAELSYLDPDMPSFKIGQNVRVYSNPHLLDKVLVTSKISYDLSSSSKKITIGTPPRQDLSQITGSGSGGTSVSGGGSGGGGGGGGGGGSVVSVEPIILTGDNIAIIYVNGRANYIKYDASGKADKADTYTKTEVDTALNLKANKSETYTKTEIDAELALKSDKSNTYTKTEVDGELDLKADKADTYTKIEVDDAIELSAHNSKYKFVDFHNRNSITLGNLTTRTTHSTKIMDEDFATDSKAPLSIEIQIKLISEMLNYLSSTSEEGYPSVTMFDPSVIRFEFMLNNKILDSRPEQVLIPGKNTLFYKIEIPSIDIQMHNLKVYIYLKDGRITIGQNEIQLIVSGTGLDAEGTSGVAVAEDEFSLFNIGSTLFVPYSDDSEGRPVTVVPDESFADTMSMFNITGMFTAFTEATSVTTEIPEEEEGDN